MDIWVILKLVGSLALLMYGMKALSEELQKMAGPQMRQWLQRATSNRFMGMLMGMIVTAAIQSSTATTLMTVSFVNAGLFTLGQAISVILGAHIGTTLTAWIMSAGLAGGAMGGIAQYVYIAFFVGIILIYMKKRKSFGVTSYLERDSFSSDWARSNPREWKCIWRKTHKSRISSCSSPMVAYLIL